MTARDDILALGQRIGQSIIGQDAMVERLLLGLLSNGHLLVEGLPGLAKTRAIKSLARNLASELSRVQFTPDLLPADITGSEIYFSEGGKGEFKFQQGPIFANLILADEINRAPAKVQSALLEAMEERQVTVGGKSYPLPDLFMVMATQNPIEQEGTYPLPEAQLDRFLFKLEVKRNPVEVLQRIVQSREIGVEPEIRQVLSREEFSSLTLLARRIFMPEVVANYVARLVHGTHAGESKTAEGVKFGASPRAALALSAAAKARALLQRRLNASFEDVQAAAKPVLQHRLVLDYSAKLDGKTAGDVVDSLLREIQVQDRGLPKTLASAKVQG